MRTVFLLLLLAVAVAGIWAFARARAQAPSASASPTHHPEHPELYRAMRDLALHGKREEIGLAPGKTPTEPYGLLMDTTFDWGSATLLAMNDGSASIYLSNGGGFLGGKDIPPVNRAARDMVALAAKFQPQATATKDFPLPKEGQTTFYFLTDAGVFTSSARVDDLAESEQGLFFLYDAGQKVIGEFRIDQRNKK